MIFIPYLVENDCVAIWESNQFIPEIIAHRNLNLALRRLIVALTMEYCV